MVASVQAQQAPFVRLADRYAVAFVPLTLVLAGAAWVVSGDPVARRGCARGRDALPADLSRRPSRWSPVCLRMARSRCDREGGRRPRAACRRAGSCCSTRPGRSRTVARRWPSVMADERTDREAALRLAGSLEQVSPHVLASAIVREAQRSAVWIWSLPTDVEEVPGRGVRGHVDGHGSRWAVRPGSWIPRPRHGSVRLAGAGPALDGSITVFVGVDGSSPPACAR